MPADPSSTTKPTLDAIGRDGVVIGHRNSSDESKYCYIYHDPVRNAYYVRIDELIKDENDDSRRYLPTVPKSADGALNNLTNSGALFADIQEDNVKGAGAYCVLLSMENLRRK